MRQVKPTIHQNSPRWQNLLLISEVNVTINPECFCLAVQLCQFVSPDFSCSIIPNLNWQHALFPLQWIFSEEKWLP